MVKGRTFESREEPVILEKAMNPTGGAIIFDVLTVASLGIQSEVGQYFKTLGEPHSADPLAMWCGEGERETPPYPFSQCHFLMNKKISLAIGPNLIACTILEITI